MPLAQQKVWDNYLIKHAKKDGSRTTLKLKTSI